MAFRISLWYITSKENSPTTTQNTARYSSIDFASWNERALTKNQAKLQDYLGQNSSILFCSCPQQKQTLSSLWRSFTTFMKTFNQGKQGFSFEPHNRKLKMALCLSQKWKVRCFTPLVKWLFPLCNLSLCLFSWHHFPGGELLNFCLEIFCFSISFSNERERIHQPRTRSHKEVWA